MGRRKGCCETRLILKQRSTLMHSPVCYGACPPLPVPIKHSQVSETARAPRGTILWKQNWHFLLKARGNFFTRAENEMPILALPSIPRTFLTTKKEDFSAGAVIGKVKPWHFFFWRKCSREVERSHLYRGRWCKQNCSPCAPLLISAFPQFCRK